MEGSKHYSLVQIITDAPPGFYRMVEPPCSPDREAYRRWEGLIVEKHDFTAAITVADPAGTGLKVRGALPLYGFAVRAAYEQVGYRGK
jgi:hypothetical protein